jgi:hypothetical protein
MGSAWCRRARLPRWLNSAKPPGDVGSQEAEDLRLKEVGLDAVHGEEIAIERKRERKRGHRELPAREKQNSRIVNYLAGIHDGPFFVPAMVQLHRRHASQSVISAFPGAFRREKGVCPLALPFFRGCCGDAPAAVHSERPVVASAQSEVPRPCPPPDR